jgi:hypothetical protein
MQPEGVRMDHDRLERAAGLDPAGPRPLRQRAGGISQDGGVKPRRSPGTGSLERAAGAGDRWQRLAVAAWVVVLVVICALVLVARRSRGVYPIFANAGQSWLEGEGLYPATARPGVPDEFRYSPPVAALFAPLGLLPEGVGGCLWRLLNAAVYLGGFAWWCLAVLPAGASLSRGQRAALWLLLIPLSVGSLHNGQSNALVAGLLLAATAGAARARWNLAAACVAVACLFKGYPLAVGLLLAAVYPRQFGPRLVLALAAGLALPFLLQRPAYVARAYEEWFRLLGADDRKDRPLDRGYRDLWQLFRVAGIQISRAVYLALQLAAAGGAAALCLAGRAAHWPRRRLLATLLALGTCWMLLCGPATESSTYILVAPVLAAALVIGWAESGRTAAWSLPGLSFALLAVGQVGCWFPVGKQLHTLGIQPLATLLLTVSLVGECIADLARRKAGEPVAP